MHLPFFRLAVVLTFGTLALSACSPQAFGSAPQFNPANRVQSQTNQPSQPSQMRSREGLRQGVILLRRVRFDKWDLKPKDDHLTRDEVKDQDLRLPGLINGFKDYDTNRDGRISFNEFLREDIIAMWSDIYADLTDNEFIVRDTDGNRQIEGPELQSLQELFKRWPDLNHGDLNNDGRVSYDEFQDTYMQVAPWLNPGRNLPQG